MTYDDVSERFCTVNSAADNFEDVLRLAWHRRLIKVCLCNVKNLNDHCKCVSCQKSFYATYMKWLVITVWRHNSTWINHDVI